eukprot:8060022-Pyramimonas_sp.AAC.1
MFKAHRDFGWLSDAKPQCASLSFECRRCLSPTDVGSRPRLDRCPLATRDEGPLGTFRPRARRTATNGRWRYHRVHCAP